MRLHILLAASLLVTIPMALLAPSASACTSSDVGGCLDTVVGLLPHPSPKPIPVPGPTCWMQDDRIWCE